MDIPRDAETLIMVMAMNHGHISCQGHYANFFGDCIKVPEKSESSLWKFVWPIMHITLRETKKCTNSARYYK